jgi:hypothetical protein
VFTYHNACSWAAHFNCIYHEKQKGKPSEKDLLFYYFSSDLSVTSNKPMQIAKIFMIIPFVLVSLFQLHISIKSKKANPPKKICPFEK